MPSFCTVPPQAVAGLVPAQMPAVHSVPPQLAQLNQLIQKVKFELAGAPGGPAPVLGGPMPQGGGGAVPLAPPQPIKVAPALAALRPDLEQAQLLPDLTPQQWMEQALAATAPAMELPAAMPQGPGALLTQAEQIAMAAAGLPLSDPQALAQDVNDTMQCLAQGPGQAAPALQSIATPDFTRMTEAARETLALRQEGICPLDLAGVDEQFRIAENLAPARPTYPEFLAQAEQARPAPLPFAMTSPQVDLANHFASLAPLAELPEKLGLPDLASPEFVPALQAQLNGLAAIPVPEMAPPLAPVMSMAQKIEAIDVIKQAFGDDALTPEGTARVNQMLEFMSRLEVPSPGTPAVVLQNQLGAVPPLETVKAGAEVAQSAAPTLATAAATPPPAIPLSPHLMAFKSLGAVMQNTLGIDPISPLGANPAELLAAASA